MTVMLKKAREMYKLQKEAKKVKKELKRIHVEAGCSGVKVVVSCDMKVVGIYIAADVPRGEIGAFAADALNRALAKAQIVSSEKMKGVMGEMGLGLGD